MNPRFRNVFLILIIAAAVGAAAVYLQGPGRHPPNSAAPVPNPDLRGLDASGRTKAERRAIVEALEAFRKEGPLLRTAEDGDATESDEHRDLEEVYGGYHPFFVRGDLDGDGRLDFAQAFVEKGAAGPWFHVAVFFGTGDGRFQKPIWVERAVSLGAGDLTIERSLLIVTPDLGLDPARRWRWDPAGNRFVDADEASRGSDPADDDDPDDTPDQKPRARV